jgi:hypothetical protein
MELTHVISETVLASSGFFTFFVNLRKLSSIDKILWGTFILSVAFAALCAAFWFAGIEVMGTFNLHIKKISTSAGVIYLVLGVYSLVAGVYFSKKIINTILLLGILSLIIFIAFNLQYMFTLMPTIGIPLVLILGLWAIKLRKYKIGLFILLGTFFSIIANFLYLFNLPFNQVDAYCLLLALALICFGFAIKSKKQL